MNLPSALEEKQKVPTRKKEQFERMQPIGADFMPGRGTHFRVWAPNSPSVSVELCPQSDFSHVQIVELEAEPQGYYAGSSRAAEPGFFYRYKLSSGSFPDPASRFQPQGPHGPSQIIDPSRFRWNDHQWGGVAREGQVIYEMHIGIFTREGTYEAAAHELPELSRLGVTVIELMPVADFPGRFGWGYDGVNLFAPTRLYGAPDDLRAFVDQAHQAGLGVILDVVYNHVGPDGNYLKQFAKDYFTDRHANEWGDAINFDGENSGPVREFFSSNAAYWIREFHLDGLRLDATQQIFDASPVHILKLIGERVREAATGRQTYIVAENEVQHSCLVRPADAGGYGLDALWNDDFHHSARVALTGHSEAYYSDYRGTPQELISAIKRGYLFQGQWSPWQNKRRGRSALDLQPRHFVNCIQNHDQVANSLRGLRLHQLSIPGNYRAMTALLLLAPATPMLFQGQEFAASAPFLFFADHKPELAKLVARGRKEFLSQFPSVARSESEPYLALPHDEQTFLCCKLDLSERQKHRPIYEMHCDLLKLRRQDPVFAQPARVGVDGAVLSESAFLLRFFGDTDGDRLLLVNLGRDLELRWPPEPLLAPPEGRDWNLTWSSESPVYGGGGTPALQTAGTWRLPGQAALVLASTLICSK